MLTLILGSASVVYALPYSDLYDAGGIYMHGGLLGGDAKFWTFDITKDGFNPEAQDITAATITLNFTDSRSWWDWSEFAYLDVGTNNFLWEVDTGDASFQLSSLMTLSDTGKVDASLTAIWGDFKFNFALLTADGTLPDIETSPIPEPAAILLFGTGLTGLAFVARRSRFINRLK